MAAAAIGPGDTAVVGIGWYPPSLVAPLFMKWRANNLWWCSNPSLCSLPSLFRPQRLLKTAALGQRLKILMAPLRALERVRNDTEKMMKF
jgi:hypothetical protein